VRRAVEEHLGIQPTEEPPEPVELAVAVDDAVAAGHVPPRLVQLCAIFELSDWERQVLLLCAGVELDPALAELIAQQNGRQGAQPTFGSALRIFPGGSWAATMPAAPLRRWHLVHVDDEPLLTRRALRIDEHVLHYLLGFDSVDQQLESVFRLARSSRVITPTQQALAGRLAAACTAAGGNLPLLRLTGPDVAGQRAVAATASRALGATLWTAHASALASLSGSRLAELSRLWERDSVLGGLALLINCHDMDSLEPSAANAVRRAIEDFSGVVFIATSDRWQATTDLPVITADVHIPDATEQVDCWEELLGNRAPQVRDQLINVVGQFQLSVPQIEAASADALGRTSPDAPGHEATDLRQALWTSCRVQARPSLDDLAQRIEARASWENLVIPAAARATLQRIVGQVRNRRRVYQEWGFAAASDRGLGISAVFAGPSGTGKTMAAEVLARDLDVDLYRIDLSAVISKYIGETEKNLRRVFDVAEGAGVVLLFDEADALFGRRSEVKDSHDRYANVEISYLLQRMEAYAGLAILTTNREADLDRAFLRRIRFILRFPFPDAQQRAEIWRRILPEATPTEGVDIAQLARLNVAGGTIRTIALNGAFHAASEGAPLQMRHLLEAARTEYEKLKQPFWLADVAERA